jgi:hypothetical protein
MTVINIIIDFYILREKCNTSLSYRFRKNIGIYGTINEFVILKGIKDIPNRWNDNYNNLPYT